MPDLKNRIFRSYLEHFFSPDFSASRSLLEQQKCFAKTIASLSGTAIGRDMKLKAGQSYKDFSRAAPVTSYDFYEPYINRIIAGEQKVMTEHEVKWFGKTAGTTSGKSKLIPITKPIIRQHVRGTFFGLSRMHSFDPTIDILSHKNFVMTGGVYETLSPSGITVADISAIMIHNVPPPFRNIYVPSSNELSTHPSWEHKLNKISKEAKNADIGALVGVPTWHLAVLNKLQQETHFTHLTELWKNLRYFMHGGVNFEPYRNHFKEIAGREDFVFYEVYNATEGFFGAQAYPDRNDLLLLTDTGIFYEFIPFAEYGTGAEKAITLKEVKPGVQYVPAITAINGLVRYVIGDVITFNELDPFTFRITGRTQEYINAFGEDLLLANVVNALTKTNEKFNCTVREFTVAPMYIHVDSKGRMQFLVEFIQPPPDLVSYSAELDIQLQSENSNYAQKRNNNLALTALELIVAPPGTFYRWMEAKGKLGGQNKVPHLVNGRKIMDEILATLK